jgi:hypothetical protein
MGKLVSDLAAAGAKNIVVTNAFGTSEDFTPGAEYDRFLTVEYAEVKLSHPDLNLYHLNAMDIFDAIHSSAEAWGITRLSGAACQDCLTKENPVRVAANPNEFFSWDTIHATAPIHEALGNAAFAIISGEVPGDLNFDRSVSSKDIDALAAAKRNDATAKLFDLNVDGRLDHDDIVHLVHNLAGSWFGDANLDGEFNTRDLVQILEAGKYETQEYAGWSEGDWNGDGVFDTGDLVEALEDGGYEVGPRADAMAVPEPGGWLLLVMGLLPWRLTRGTRRPISSPS